MPSSPSSEVALGPTFTPLKDLASSLEFQNTGKKEQTQPARQIQIGSISNSISEPKTKEFKNAVNKIDPTKKATEMLTKSLMEQLEQRKRNDQKVNALESKSQKIYTRSQHHRRVRPESGSKATPKTKPEKRKAQKNTNKNESSSKKPKIQPKTTQKTLNKSSPQDDFGSLKMVPLKPYEIPPQISNIEKMNDTSHLTLIERNVERSKLDPESYI